MTEEEHKISVDLHADINEVQLKPRGPMRSARCERCERCERCLAKLKDGERGICDLCRSRPKE